MNIVDCLAIAPYYLTLFFFPDPEIRVSQEDDLYSTVMPANSEEEEESGFGDVGRIMQVRIRHIPRENAIVRLYSVKNTDFGLDKTAPIYGQSLIIVIYFKVKQLHY